MSNLQYEVSKKLTEAQEAEAKVEAERKARIDAAAAKLAAESAARKAEAEAKQKQDLADLQAKHKADQEEVLRRQAWESWPGSREEFDAAWPSLKQQMQVQAVLLAQSQRRPMTL